MKAPLCQIIKKAPWQKKDPDATRLVDVLSLENSEATRLVEAPNFEKEETVMASAVYWKEYEKSEGGETWDLDIWESLDDIF
jgi:hypothetical protein